MHIINDENGNPCAHAHHEHTHTHTYEHSHEHSHMSGHEEDHEHSHEGGCQEGHCHTHGDEGHCHGHGDEGHCHGGEHCHNQGGEGVPADKNAALLQYMLDHNTHHAAELDQMAAKLAEDGHENAAEQIRRAVDEFQKGNMYLGLALSLVKQP
ncbi:MAG: cobalt transporter [Eubacteriales bacterium]|nr:cobalt transporter [Eubacteriales bacterium]